MESLLRQIIEAALIASDKPLSIDKMLSLFNPDECPDRDELIAALNEIENACEDRGFELKQVASGYRFQIRQETNRWVSRLWDEKPLRYSRALLETLALIAYRQPITRGEIEKIRGVSVSTSIFKTLHEREWIRVVGHRDVPGRPALYATTRLFLDYFTLRNLDELPPLPEIKETYGVDLSAQNARETELSEQERQQQAAKTEAALARSQQEEGELDDTLLDHQEDYEAQIETTLQSTSSDKHLDHDEIDDDSLNPTPSEMETQKANEAQAIAENEDKPSNLIYLDDHIKAPERHE